MWLATKNWKNDKINNILLSIWKKYSRFSSYFHKLKRLFFLRTNWDLDLQTHAVRIYLYASSDYNAQKWSFPLRISSVCIKGLKTKLRWSKLKNLQTLKTKLRWSRSIFSASIFKFSKPKPISDQKFLFYMPKNAIKLSIFKCFKAIWKGKLWPEMGLQLFHDGGPHHIETNPLICSANQWTGFCMIGTSTIKVK